MAKMLYVGSHRTDDPTRAGLCAEADKVISF